MKKFTVMTCCLLLAQASAMATASLPKDVAKFVERREGCDHMRGEMPEPGDHGRMKEIIRETIKLCKGTDKKLLRLKRKYVGNARVTALLAEFEPTIEATPPSRQH